mmetsp:Transcript_148657/g.477337  ORF Transcript_148657/g.477337 Transcript_148657/m.477337 type:complete len:175 (-) Transcript_148657:233-757(-)
MGGRGKGEGKSDASKQEAASLLTDKGYKDAVDEMAKATVVKPTDLDEKSIKYLDFLEANGGRSIEGIQHLQKSLESLTRDHVQHWPAYVYKILKSFDQKAYEAMKLSEGKRVRPPRTAKDPSAADKEKNVGKFPVSNFSFNAAAPAFVPGAAWGSAPAAAPVPVGVEVGESPPR